VIDRVEDGDEFQYKITDNNSLNGVTVNGIRVKEAVLKYDMPLQTTKLTNKCCRHNDVIVFGGSQSTPVGSPVHRPASDLIYTFIDPKGVIL